MGLGRAGSAETAPSLLCLNFEVACPFDAAVTSPPHTGQLLPASKARRFIETRLVVFLPIPPSAGVGLTTNLVEQDSPTSLRVARSHLSFATAPLCRLLERYRPEPCFIKCLIIAPRYNLRALKNSETMFLVAAPSGIRRKWRALPLVTLGPNIARLSA